MMDLIRLGVFWGSFAAALALFFSLLARILQYFWRPFSRKPPLSKIGLIGQLFAVVFFLRFGVEFVLTAESEYSLLRFDGTAMGLLDLATDSFVHALQTFSMDEDYTAYLLAGRAFVRGQNVPAVVAGVYGVVSNLVNLAAPLLGGAVLLDILCDFFPPLRYRLLLTRRRYIFSELNEQSVTLAESICAAAQNPAGPRKHRCSCVPGIVFTDAYTDPGSEESSELAARARALNAVRLRQDITEFRPVTRLDKLLDRVRPCAYVFLLMDADTTENVNAAVELTRREDLVQGLPPHSTGCVLLFSDREADSAITDDLNRSLNDRARAAANDASRVPFLLLVCPARSCAERLLMQSPLFLPLAAAAYPRLDVLVVGSDLYAQEYLALAYSLGQLLRPASGDKIPLTLHCIAETPARRQALEQAMRHRMPEAFRPEVERQSDSRLLFYTAEPLSQEFDSLVERIGAEVSTAVLFVQDENVARDLTLDLQRRLERRELHTRRPVMLFVRTWRRQAGEALQACCETLRLSRGQPPKDTRRPGSCFVTAFGSLQESFSYDTIFAPDLLSYSLCLNDAYSGGKAQDFRFTITNSYNMRASTAAALHGTAKLYSAGLLRLPQGEFTPAPPLDDLHRLSGSFASLDQAAMNRIAWLEHQRWNAYMRSIGFAPLSPQQLQDLQVPAEPGTTACWQCRAISLRLHNCLVSSSPDKAFFNRSSEAPCPQEAEQPEWDLPEPDPSWDELDTLSWRQHRQARDFYRRTGRQGQVLPGMYVNYKAYDYLIIRSMGDLVRRYLQEGREFYTLETLLNAAPPR